MTPRSLQLRLDRHTDIPRRHVPWSQLVRGACVGVGSSLSVPGPRSAQWAAGGSVTLGSLRPRFLLVAFCCQPVAPGDAIACPIPRPNSRSRPCSCPGREHETLVLLRPLVVDRSGPSDPWDTRGKKRDSVAEPSVP